MVNTLSFFSLQNAVCFIIQTHLIPVLFTFYIQSVLKLKKNSGAKRLSIVTWNEGKRDADTRTNYKAPHYALHSFLLLLRLLCVQVLPPAS